MSFRDVTDLKIGDLNGLVCILLDVSDVSHWGRERTRFKIQDVEYSCFSFYCYEFDFDIDNNRHTESA